MKKKKKDSNTFQICPYVAERSVGVLFRATSEVVFRSEVISSTSDHQRSPRHHSYTAGRPMVSDVLEVFPLDSGYPC